MACAGPWRLLLQLASIMALVAPGSGNGYGQLWIKDYYYERLKVGGLTAEAPATNEIKVIVAHIAPRLINKMKWPFHIWRPEDITAISYRQQRVDGIHYVKVCLKRSHSDMDDFSQQLYLHVVTLWSTPPNNYTTVQGWIEARGRSPIQPEYLTPQAAPIPDVVKIFEEVKADWLKKLPRYTETGVWGYRKMVGLRMLFVGVYGTITNLGHVVRDNYILQILDGGGKKAELIGFRAQWGSFPTDYISYFDDFEDNSETMTFV